MDATEVATQFTALCAKGAFEEAGRTFWSDDVVSLEAMPGEMSVCRGRAAVEAKTAWWNANHEVHGATVAGPYVHGDQFAVRFSIEVTPKGGQRMAMDEIALYTVKDGKIVEERFLYGV